MAQGLRKHRHICFVEEVHPYTKKGKQYKKIKYSCYVPNCRFCYYRNVRCVEDSVNG